MNRSSPAISDEDLMEYLRMEQKRMELLQQAKEVREKRFWTTFQLAYLSVIRYPRHLFSEG